MTEAAAGAASASAAVREVRRLCGEVAEIVQRHGPAVSGHQEIRAWLRGMEEMVPLLSWLLERASVCFSSDFVSVKQAVAAFVEELKKHAQGYSLTCFLPSKRCKDLMGCALTVLREAIYGGWDTDVYSEVLNDSQQDTGPRTGAQGLAGRCESWSPHLARPYSPAMGVAAERAPSRKSKSLSSLYMGDERKASGRPRSSSEPLRITSRNVRHVDLQGLSELASSGSSTVYHCICNDRPVAVKIFKTHAAFLREVEALRRLNGCDLFVRNYTHFHGAGITVQVRSAAQHLNRPAR